MGTTLTGTQINNTYDGLIKTTDNGPIGSTPKVLTDGLGNDAQIAVGTNSTVFTGTADFTGATVTGISGVTGAQGAQGAAGAQGAQGTQGVAGPQGAQGAQGAAAAGGGTPPMSLYELPAIAGPIFSVVEGYRTWVGTTGYGTQGMGAKIQILVELQYLLWVKIGQLTIFLSVYLQHKQVQLVELQFMIFNLMLGITLY